ncbi:MAG: SPOR domain-containing protein [Desulfovibrio sp.]|nr:SPOR domain-containing protein [Desulfovibrio sp.]
MALPLRKIFQKNLLPGAESAARGRPQDGARAGGGSARRRTLDLSGAAAAALGLALVAAVGWAFFMGYLVGRGEHPERGVESVAGLLRPGAPAKTGEAPRNAPLPGEEVLLEAGTPAAPESAQPLASAAAPSEAPPVTPPQAAAVAPGETAPAETGSTASAYPFSRPQGESLAAWGINPEALQAGRPASAPSGQAAQKPAAQATAPAQARKAPPPAEPRFDYLFQAAAFKGPVDAERLRGRLAAAGLRASVRQSGKVRLVLVSLRGTAQEAQKVRGQLAGMGLGRPIQLEKKPVAEKTGGKSRRRSAP